MVRTAEGQDSQTDRRMMMMMYPGYPPHPPSINQSLFASVLASTGNPSGLGRHIVCGNNLQPEGILLSIYPLVPVRCFTGRVNLVK